MRHLGDITKISGYTAPVVDCVIGGSPCQDLSIAGKRAGLAGERSGLYMDQIRIIKEMREKDAQSGRTGHLVRPRFMVWENVPGAFSSNGGQDFAAVIEEAIRVADPEAPSVPVPEKGWPTSGVYADERGRWSVAWRVLDAQFWGVTYYNDDGTVRRAGTPQRRRRIALVADFGGLAAPEILFVREGVSGYFDESEPERKEDAGDAGDGAAGASYAIQGSMIGRADQNGPQGDGVNVDVSFTLNTIDRHAVACNPKSGVYVADTSRTLDLNGGNPACNQGGMAVVCAGFKPNNGEKARSIGYGEEQSPTLNAENKPTVLCLNDQGGNVMGVSHDVSGTMRAQEHGHQPTILDMSHACDVIRDCGDVAPGLQARMGTGGNQVPLTYQMQGFGDYREGNVASSCKQRDFKDGTDLAITNMAVRRLTPMECERLQGFPDGWTDIGEWIDEEGRTHKQADSPRYKALGNSIALPFWYWMFCRMAEHLPEKATLGSLFDGISGFNVCWARVHGSECCRWSSEIEQFPIAVTKKHFGDEEAGKEGDFEKFFGRNKKENV